MARHRKRIIDITSAIVLLALIVLDTAMWKDVFISGSGSGIYFLPVTQGESALLVLPNDVTILTDAGPDADIVDDLQKVLPSGNSSYIDLAIISYPQSVDYEGYQYLLEHYRVGAFLSNGRADAAYSSEWNALVAAIASKHIPLITLAAGDSIRYGTGAIPAAEIDILSPEGAFAHSPDPSDTAIVQRVVTRNFTVLLAADIGTNVEDALLGQKADLRADILKAPFPGLGSVGGDAFLRAVAPRIIVVAPGVKGTASVPTKAMLAHLASSTTAAVVSPKAGQFLLYNK